MYNSPIIICASGNSISEGLEKGLQDKLKNHVTIGLNSFYKFGFETTFLSFCDPAFYIDNLEDLKKLGLIIGRFDPELTKKQDTVQENTILLPHSKSYHSTESFKINIRVCQRCNYNFEEKDPETWPIRCPECKFRNTHSKGIYGHHLVGMFSLTLAIALGFKNIYLLGYDCCEVKGKTHFYQDEKIQTTFRGVGKLNGIYKTSTYNTPSNLNDVHFAPYKKELERISIKNVSLDSILTVFPKISYDQFLSELDEGNCNQEQMRGKISEYIIDQIK